MTPINSLAALKRNLSKGDRLKRVWPNGDSEIRTIVKCQTNAIALKGDSQDEPSWLYFRSAKDFDFYSDHFEIDSLFGGKIKYYYKEGSK